MTSTPGHGGAGLGDGRTSDQPASGGSSAAALRTNVSAPPPTTSTIHAIATPRCHRFTPAPSQPRDGSHYIQQPEPAEQARAGGSVATALLVGPHR
ncbi:hypothetical protein ABZW30_35005 [Kitasatospora sp. NPDC004669]|uniref:hypothetical protein n=1 Tax=Kitasatospora sp. NPDC004669 TaxID=3154555 RepID=UPI0033BAC59C